MSSNVPVCPNFPQQRGYSARAPPRLWEHIRSHALPSDVTPMICRDNEIIYGCLNTIRAWNYKSNEETIRFFALQQEDSITALAELPSRSLIWGSENGYLFVEKDGSWANFWIGEGAVDEISILGPDHVIVKFRDKKKTIICTANGNKLRDFDDSTEVCRYKENIFASVRDSDIEIGKVDTLENTSKFKNHFNQNFSSIRAEHDKFLLLKHADKRGFTIWCVEKNEVLRANKLNARIWTDQFQNLVLIDMNTFLIPEIELLTPEMRLTKYSHDKFTNRWVSHVSKCAGYGSVLSMIRAGRAGSYIIYGTKMLGKSFPSGIHIFNENCELIYSDSKCTDNGESDPLALVPLRNGYFAIRLSDSVRVIKKKKSPTYKSRLFVGEGDFSYTEALLRKHEVRHPELGAAITATELNDVDGFLRKRMEYLKRRGVEIHCGIDARNLHHYFYRFKRIHWNCPYGSKPAVKNVNFSNVIREFFKSCSKNQQPGDRVHVTLMQEKNGDYWKKFRQQEHPIASASSHAGYRLIKKRVFGEGRYPGYEHWKTSGMDRHGSSNDEDMREFIFEKVDFEFEYTAVKLHAVKKYRPSDSEYYFDCSTDCDSSSYEDSTSDEDTETMTEERESESYYFGRNCKRRPDSSLSFKEENMSIPSFGSNMRIPSIRKLPQRHISDLSVSSNTAGVSSPKPISTEGLITYPTGGTNIEMRPSSKPTPTEGNTSNSSASIGIALSQSRALNVEHMGNSTPSSSNDLRPNPDSTLIEPLASNPILSPNVGMRSSPNFTPTEGQKSDSTAGSTNEMRPSPIPTSTGKLTRNPTPSPNFKPRPSLDPILTERLPITRFFKCSRNVRMRSSANFTPTEWQKSNSTADAGCTTEMRPSRNLTSTGKFKRNPSPSPHFKSRPNPYPTLTEGCFSGPHLMNTVVTAEPSRAFTSHYPREPRSPYHNYNLQSTTYDRSTMGRNVAPPFGATRMNAPQQDTRPTHEPELIHIDSSPVSKKACLR